MEEVSIRNKIRKWNIDHSLMDSTLFVDKLHEAGLTDEHIWSVLKIVDEVCHYCWDGYTNCNCMRDE